MIAAIQYGAHHFLTWLLIGGIAGALAGRVVRGAGFGCLADIAVGLVGALIGGALLHALTGSDEATSFLEECLVAFLGAVILLVVLKLFTGGGRHRRFG